VSIWKIYRLCREYIFDKEYTMKNIIFKIASMTLAMAFIPAGCINFPPGTAAMKINEEDFSSDANGILRISNSTTFDVAIFAGKLGRGNYMGGIHAKGSRVIDITKIQSPLARKGAFLFRAVPYEILSKGGKTNIEEEKVVYTDLVPYDLDRPDRTVERDIFANVDDKAQTFIYLTNPTKYVVELRLDSPNGNKVAVLGPGERNKKVWIKEQEDHLPYRLFVTYVYIDPITGDVDVFTDIENKDGKRFEPRGNAGSTLQVITLPDPSTRPGGKQYNIAFIKLQNDTNGLLNLQSTEGIYLKNTRGSWSTREGDTDTYEIAADTGDSGKTYANLGVEHDSGYFKFVPPQTVKPGYVYNVIVTRMGSNYQYDWQDLGKKQEAEIHQAFLQLE
jgi:hypothetical protein